MTSILKADDKIFTMYKQYKEFLHNDAKDNEKPVYGVDSMASRLTVAHILDHVICLVKEDKPPTVRKVNNTWKRDMEKTETLGSAMEELEIMRNNAQVTSTSANVKIDWERNE